MMPSLINYYKKYLEIIKKKPWIADDIEKTLRMVSFLLSGGFKYSNLIREFLYASSFLMQLLHDIHLRKAYNIKINTSRTIENIKIVISVIQYIEVFCESYSKQIVGEIGKWITIATIQITKAILRLLLVIKYRQGIQRPIPYVPLDRENDLISKPDNKEIFTIKLKRSQRTMRSLENALPKMQRTWINPTNELSLNLFEKAHNNVSPTLLNNTHTLAEVLHIVRPVAHLSSLAKFGEKSWTPYLLSLMMDLTSLKLYNEPPRKLWNSQERMELSQRTLALLFYLLRSPCFDLYTKAKILNILGCMSERIPLLGRLLKPLLVYLPEWQKVYFYIWD